MKSGKKQKEAKVMNEFRITQDKRVLLNGKEIPGCTRAVVILEAGCDPEVEFRVAVDQVDIDEYPSTD